MAAREGLQKAAGPSESQLLKVEVPSVFLNVLPRAEEMQCLNVKRNSSCLPSLQVSLLSQVQQCWGRCCSEHGSLGLLIRRHLGGVRQPQKQHLSTLSSSPAVH